MSAQAHHWTVLRGQDEEENIIIVPEGTATAKALAELVRAVHGVDVDPTHPLIVGEAAGLKLETWRSCSKAWREANGVDEFEDYWSPDGDGKRTAHVFQFPGDVYALGDEIETEDE